MAAISLSFAKTPDTVSLGGANIVLCVLLLDCKNKEAFFNMKFYPNTYISLKILKLADLRKKIVINETEPTPQQPVLPSD